MKKLFLFLDELKDNLSDFIINTLIITFAAIFISIAVYSVSDYLTSLAYYLNPHTANVVQIVPIGADSVYEDGLFDFDEFEYSFTSTLYADAFKYDPSMGLFVVSEEFFDESLGLAGGVSHDTLADNSEGINVIAVMSANKSENGGGSMKNGMPYTVVKKWESDAPYHLLAGIMLPSDAVIALEGAVDAEAFQLTARAVVGKINVGFDEFKKKYQETLSEKGWAITKHNGLEAVASDFEGSVTMTLLGTVIFLTACAAMLVNNYLSYEKRKRAYEILLTLGARKKLFMFNSLMTRAAQLILSLALSYALSLAAEKILRVEIVSVASIFTAFGVVALLLAAGFVRYIFLLKITQAVR